MIYLGNGMYSDSGPQKQLMHYGVLGMKWGVRQARQEADAHTDLMRRRLLSNVEAKYRSGQITRDQYKMAKKRIKLDAHRQRKMDRASAKAEIYNFKHDKKYREDYKKKYKNAWFKTSDRALASRNILDKQSPGFAKFREAAVKQQNAASLFGLAGAVATSKGFVNGLNGVQTPDIEKRVKKDYISHGGPWKDHKYVKIVNGRYIYPDDIKNSSRGPTNPKDTTGSDGTSYRKPKDRNDNWARSGFIRDPMENARPKKKWKENTPKSILSRKLSAEPPTKKIPKPDGVGNRKNGAEKTGKKKSLTNDPEFVNDPNVKEYEKKTKKKLTQPKMDKPWTSVNKDNVKSAKSGQNHHSEGLKGWVKDNIIGREGDVWTHSADGKYMTNTKTGEKKKIKKSK